MAINYERVNWDTTSYVNPHNMNQMDEGIEAACNAADENSSAITAINSILPKYKEVRYAALQNSDATKYYITISNNILNDIGDGATKCLSATMSDWTGFGQTVLSLSATRDNALYLLFEKGTTFSSAYIWVKYQYI